MRVFLALLSILACGNAFCATYYVATNGSDTTGDGSISRPWRTPAHGASRLTSDGDVLLIREGTYNVESPAATINRAAAIYPRANNCTIAAYPGEAVVLRGGRNGNYGVFPTGGTIGVLGGYSGLIIDSLTIQGMVMFDGNSRGTRPSRIQNSDLSVGGDGWPGTSQGGVIWMDNAVNVEVVNNRIHDNAWGEQSFVYSNAGLFMIYECTDCLIEKNTIYKSAGTGITMKDDIQNVIIRYNWIRDNAASGIWTGNNTAEPYAKSADIYQNIISSNNWRTPDAYDEHGGISLVTQTSLVNIYNNTFHRNYYSDVVQPGTVPFTFFNNICFQSQAYYLSWPWSSSTWHANYINFNMYNGGASGWRYRSSVWRPDDLAGWRAASDSLLPGGADDNSVTSSPGFLNATGSWTSASDYKRQSYVTNGRGGSYSPVMGAYITGTEQIGYSGVIGPVPSPPANVIAE